MAETLSNLRFMVGTLCMAFIIVSASFIVTIPSVEAKSGQLEITYSFDDTQYFCGDDGKISLTIKNIDSSHQLKIVKAGIHFDWMQSDYYYFNNNSGNPVMLASGQSTDVFTPSFEIPSGTSISDHSWSLHIDYQEGGLWWSDETWESASKSDFKVVDYTISVFPTTVTITQGSKATFTVTVTGQNGFSKTVNLFQDGLPVGITAKFNMESVYGTGTSTMTIEAASDAPMGSYSVSVIGNVELGHPRTAMTSVTVNSGGMFGGGVGNNLLIGLIGIVIIIAVVGLVVAVILVRQKKAKTQITYQPPPQQHPSFQPVQQQVPPIPPQYSPQTPPYQPQPQQYATPPPPVQYPPPQPSQYPTQQPPQYPPQT